MAVLYYPQRFYGYYLFIFSFLLCVYTGYYSDPVPAALEILEVAAGGGEALAQPPPPAHVFISSNSRRLGKYEAKKPLNACQSQTATFWRFVV